MQPFISLLFFFYFFINNVESNLVKDASESEKAHLKIDKNTVITRNMKLHKRKGDSNKQAQEPDWSYSSYPQEVAVHAEQFKRNMSECLKEVQASDRRAVKRLSPRTDSPVHGECLIACVLKRNGVIGKGKIHKDNLMQLLQKFFAKDVKLMKKMERSVDRCIDRSSRLTDECQMASQLNDCTNELMVHTKHKVFVNK